MTDRIIRQGQIIAMTSGEYSEYCLLGHVRAIRDFDPDAEAQRFKSLDWRPSDAGYHSEISHFIAWAIRDGLVEPVEPDHVVELYLGGHESLYPDIVDSDGIDM